MLIRPLTPDDAPFLWDALYHAIHVPPSEQAPPYDIVKQPELSRYVADWMSYPDDFGLAIEEAGQLIGAAWLRCWPSDKRGFGFIDEKTPELSMALLPEYRGRGLGTRLLRQLLSAAEACYDAVSLSVSESNPARQLYERVGFIPFSKPQGGSITMIKRFAPRV
jgi:GNAT superfamily N-acetyltransferase